MKNKSHAVAAGAFVLLMATLLVAMAVWLTRDTSSQRVFEISSQDAVTGLAFVQLDDGVDSGALGQRQHLRAQRGQRRSVLSAGDAVASGTLTLRLELEEFSQLFATAQTRFVLQKPAASADAAGGVKALAQAIDALIPPLDNWLQQAATAEPVP